MNNFSIDNRLDPTGLKPANHAARIQALAEEYETKSLVGSLSKIYRFAESIDYKRVACRKCARCCDQTIRPLAAYAVEIAYLVGNTAAENIPEIEGEEGLCPAQGEDGTCAFYLKRMLGCRLFLPWEEWTKTKGCANYPHSPESMDKIHYMLSLVERLNQDFIRTVGLHHDFDFDYLAHWSIATWFSPIATITAQTGINWGL